MNRLREAELAGTPGFDRERFRAGFLAALPGTIGDPDWHEHSFRMIWERLYGNP
jgi:hypothetical protein